MDFWLSQEVEGLNEIIKFQEHYGKITNKSIFYDLGMKDFDSNNNQLDEFNKLKGVIISVNAHGEEGKDSKSGSLANKDAIPNLNGSFRIETKNYKKKDLSDSFFQIPKNYHQVI